jgi:1,4-dihydroxy-6-naphthoate synthase
VVALRPDRRGAAGPTTPASHPGQLTYASRACAASNSAWWDELTGGLPLPLGANTIHKRHGERMPEIARILEASIRYGLEHRAEALDYALGWARDMEVALADEFVGMYVNHWTLDYGDRGRAAIRELLDRAHGAGLIRVHGLEFVTT